MQWLTQFGLERSRLTILAMVGLISLGALLYSEFPKREDPEISIRTSVVTTQFPGMAPERIELLIADPVERKIREIPEVEDIRTRIFTGVVSINVDLKDEIDDLDAAWQELRDKMEEVERDLPQGSVGPFVDTNFGDVSIASIALTADGFSMREMELAAEELQRYLYTLDGISKVDLYGAQEERVWLELDAERVASVGVQIETLINDMQRQNIILPAGNLNADGTSILLEASGDFSSVDEIASMITRIAELDDYVRLGDLLTVRRGLVSPKDKPAFYNGEPTIVVSVQMQSGEDIEAVGRRIKQGVAQFEQSLPIGYALNLAVFQPKEVTAAVNNAVSNVAQTFAVVCLIIGLFLGLRSSLVIASIVPLSVMFALIGMDVLAISLEQVSIAAIIVSLGLLVDNGVVIVEDIIGRVHRGESREAAAINAGKQFAIPLLVSSMTTVFAFVPFFLLEGAEGEYAFSLGAVVALTLLGSWISALYFLPFIATRFLKDVEEREDGKAESATERIITRLTQFYRGLLANCLRFSPIILLGCYSLVVMAILTFSLVPNQMFPLSDRSQVLIYQDMPKGTDISATEETAQAVSTWLMDKTANPAITDHVLYIGSGGPRFYLALNPADEAPETAFFLINLASNQDAVELSESARRHLVENHPEARFKVKRLSMGASESGTVEIEIAGPDLETLLITGRRVEAAFRDAPGLSQNENDWGERSMKVEIDIDQDKARRIGIDSQSIAQILSAYFDGYVISDYREDNQSVPIVLRAAEKNRDSADDLLNIIVGNDGEAIALEQIAQLKPSLEYSQIRRLNQVRTITVTAKSELLTATELLTHAQAKLEALDLPEGYSITVGGEIDESAETNEKLGAGLPVAFLMMLIVVVYLFNSFRRTLIVFSSIPLILVGVPFGLLLLQQPMSFFGMLGIISLAGIIINNGIVLIDQIDIDRQNLPLKQAIENAASTRLRPIVLTSATTVLGLLPLYLFGGALWTPLAVVMMSGLMVASVLTLVFIPSAYWLLFRKDG